MILSWNTTKRCNLFCEHCFRESGPNVDCTNELSTEEGKRLLEEAQKAGFKLIIFSGGEPLLREDIFELIDHAYGLKLIPALGTNGVLITEEIAAKIREHHVNAVSISLDSLDEDKHDEFRRSYHSHALAVKGIEACLKAGLKVQINFTVTKNNIGELEGIINYANSKSCSCFFFFLVDVGRGKDIYKHALSKEEYKYAIDFILDKRKEVNVELKPTCAPQFMVEAFDKGIPMRYTRGCIAGVSYCCVLPNGDVHICPYSPIKAGSTREQSFDNIWENSEIFNKLRNFENYKGKCRGCKHINLCGGCRARAFSHTGDFLEEDIYCLLEGEL